VTYSQKLLDDFVVIKLGDETPAKIKLPDWKRVLRGWVVAVGPGRLLYSGKRAKMTVKVGEYVIFVATAGMDSSYSGEAIRLLRATDIDAVLK
jgi:chaperonin GroES